MALCPFSSSTCFTDFSHLRPGSGNAGRGLSAQPRNTEGKPAPVTFKEMTSYAFRGGQSCKEQRCRGTQGDPQISKPSLKREIEPSRIQWARRRCRVRCALPGGRNKLLITETILVILAPNSFVI